MNNFKLWLRKFTKVICWLYIVLGVGMVLYHFSGINNDRLAWIFYYFTYYPSFPVFVLSLIDLFKKPRSLIVLSAAVISFAYVGWSFIAVAFVVYG